MREPYAETRVRDRRPRRAWPDPAPFARHLAANLPPLTPKEQRACCTAHRDDQGRLPIGFCGPDCLGRTERDERRRRRFA